MSFIFEHGFNIRKYAQFNVDTMIMIRIDIFPSDLDSKMQWMQC